MGIIEIILFLSAAAFIFYKWATATFKTFEERGVPFEKPLPLVGNSANIMLGKSSFQKNIWSFYERTKAHKVVGYFNFRTPMFTVNDPECIKKITVKDFDHFTNHHPMFKSDEPLINDMLSIMKDQRWKDMRNTLTPVFTGAKMRAMFGLMNECFAECLEHLKNQNKNGADGFDIEMKELCTRLSNDLIASTAFGLKVNSYKDRDNDFYQIGMSIAFFRGKQLFKFMLASVAPPIFKLLGLHIFDAQKTQYFIRLVVDTMKYRDEHKIVRPDMIQLLLEAKKEAAQQWTDEEIVAQCFIFFFAAFENNANLICTTTYELALNPHVQQELYEEVKAASETLSGAPLNYDVLKKMSYMDNVVNESLRKWTLAAATDRICNKDYTLHDEDGNKIIDFKVGDKVWLPISGLHWDEKYYDNPKTFDPTRFDDENKDKLVPYTYLPFGVGPRNCIGNRYALMQAKAMIYNLLLSYKLELSTRSPKDLMEESTGFQLTPKDGYWLKLVPRK